MLEKYLTLTTLHQRWEGANINIKSLIVERKLVPSWILTRDTAYRRLEINWDAAEGRWFAAPPELWSGDDIEVPVLVPEHDEFKYCYLVEPVVLSPLNCEFRWLSESQTPVRGGDWVWELTRPLPLETVIQEGVVSSTEVERVERFLFDQDAATPPIQGAEQVDSGSEVLKRAALIEKYLNSWPKIESDLRHSNENGLSTAAKAPTRGDWFENKAVKWAEQRGKLTSQDKAAGQHLMRLLPGTKYTSE